MPRGLADLVAQHLVASGRFLDDDPERAYLHARTARRLAARLGGVREAVAITAYLAEHYDEALTEFRAVRRMTGNHEVLAMMADCERALGRPEKALTLTRDKHVRDLSEATQIELLIVAAGARRDMKQTAAAIQTLEVPELTKRTRAEWLPRLRYAYADALEEAGRTEEALVWFHRAAGVDADGATGAAERAARLEGLEFTDLDEDDDYDDAYDEADGELDEADELADERDELDDEQDAADDERGAADDERDEVGDRRDQVDDAQDEPDEADDRDELADERDEAEDEQVAADDERDEVGDRRDEVSDAQDELDEADERADGRHAAEDERGAAEDELDAVEDERAAAEDGRDEAEDELDAAEDERGGSEAGVVSQGGSADAVVVDDALDGEVEPSGEKSGRASE